MTEYETDPQRRPASTDAEPSHPTAELPRATAGQSDSPAAPAPGDSPAPLDEAAPTGVDAPAAGAAPDAPAAGAASGAPAAGAAWTGRDGTGDTVATPAGAVHPAVPGQPAPAAAPTSPYAPHWAGHAAGQPRPAGPYPGGPWYAGQQQPGWHPGHPGQPGAVPPQYPGQPVPPWAQGPAPRPSRVGRFVAGGAVALALMLGSGVAGGALVAALDGDGGTITRNYSSAPVINQGDLPRIAASVQDSVVSIATGSGEGSGVILTADGYVLTNNHVVAGAGRDTVQVVLADGRSVQAKIVGTDPKTDLAVVKASGVSDLKPATFGDSDAMQVGDTVLALGSPLGLQGSVTAGILSARDRTIQAGESGQQRQSGGASSISGLLQTDAPINPGNSGGALVNTRGQVIGINTAIATAGQGTGNIGVGFAIPSNKAKDVAEKLQRGEKVSHPSLGVSVTGAEGGGALVSTVAPGSAADKAGLRQGDVITRFGDKAINDSNDLVAAVQAGKVGDRVEVEYRRNSSTATTTATLAEAS